MQRDIQNRPTTLLCENLKGKDRVDKYISDDYTRSQLVAVGQELAKKSYYKEALWIVDILLNDPDPSIKEKGEFNYHKAIIRGEDTRIITSVRGRLPWLLQEIAFDEKHINTSFKKTKLLIEKDNNLYVIQQCIVPLKAILQRKNLLKPEKNKQELHNLVFKILRKYSKYPAIQHRLCLLFTRYRDLNENDAGEVVKYLGNNPDIANFIIYYALYRSEKGNDKLDFDPVILKEILRDKIKNGNDELRRQIAWNFSKILDSRKEEFVKLQEYIDEFVSSRYSNEAYFSIFQIVQNNINDRYTICKKWLLSMISRLHEYLESSEEQIYISQYEIGLTNTLNVIAKRSPDDYIKIVSKVCEIAQLEKVAFYDLKTVFGAYKFIPNKKRKTAIAELDKLWASLVRINPRLVEIDWKD